MAATKRNAGLTSAVPRATLNDEELVSVNVMNKSFVLSRTVAVSENASVGVSTFKSTEHPVLGKTAGLSGLVLLIGTLT
jgi:hypothetical protein